MKVTGKAVQMKASADALTQLKERFATWRAGRKVGMRIPPELWAAAVAMVAVHGACRVAAELHLDYAMLKQRVALAGGKVTTTELAPRFVELFAAGRCDAGTERSRRSAWSSWPTRAAPRCAWSSAARAWSACRALCSAFLGRAMIQITPHMRILVAVEPIDFRAGIDGLVGNVQEAAAGRPLQRGAVRLRQPRAARRSRSWSTTARASGCATSVCPAGKFTWWPDGHAAGPHAAGLRAAGAAHGGRPARRHTPRRRGAR